MNYIKQVSIVFTLLIGITSWAQDLNFGVKGGLNFSRINVSPQLDTPNADSRIGYHIGGVVEIGLSDNITIQPEVMISSYGAKFEDREDIESVKLSYVNLLASIKYQFDNNLNVFAGPQLNLLTGGDFEEEEKEDGSREIKDAKNFYKGSDFMIGFGAGYKINDSFEVSARYNVGLSDNNDDNLENGFFDVNQELKNNALQVSLTYFFK